MFSDLLEKGTLFGRTMRGERFEEGEWTGTRLEGQVALHRVSSPLSPAGCIFGGGRSVDLV